MKTIKVPFTVAGLDEAIKQIDAYKQSLALKCQELATRIAQVITWSAQNGFNTALAEDLIHEEGRTANVTVDAEADGSLIVVIARGKDAVFVEFGAGVYNNGTVGSSPNPNGEKLGFTIGSFSSHAPDKKAWGFRETEDGPLHLTHGTPAAMPMYRGVQEAKQMMLQLAREVFSA